MRILGALVGYIFIIFYRLKIISFHGTSQLVAFFPGDFGKLVRRKWYTTSLGECGQNLTVEWMSVIKSNQARVGDNVYIGPFCWLSMVDIKDDVMLGGHIKTLSGNAQHSFEKIDVPIRLQKGAFRTITIGKDVWVGNGSIIMEDVAQGTVVSAGSIVTKQFGELSVIAGVPAKVIKLRGQNVQS